MIGTWSPTRVFALAFLAVLMAIAPASAQNDKSMGKLKVTVSPKQAYVFVDGKAIRDGSQTIPLIQGSHTVGVYNYGYIPKTQDVEIHPGQVVGLTVALQASGDKVNGPFGDIEFKGHPRAAVLLNGTTPSYFVGHVDEFDNNWIWHQWLLVKPGSYQVTVTQQGQTVWAGPVAVKAGQRVIVDLNHNGAMTAKNFKPGQTLGPQVRFDAGVASAMVPIAPVTAQLSASQTQLTCGQSAKLDWKTTDAVDASIAGLENLPANGDRTVNPTHSTTYHLVAKGPGGEATASTAIDVNVQPTATLALSQPEVRYHKIGEKVVEQDSANLSWSTSNANKVTINPLGAVTSSGSRSIEADPDRTTAGPVNRDVTYKMSVTNACGGAATRTATLHVVGSIDPPPAVTLASVFYPTDFPKRRHPQVGLVASQKQMLAKAAATFKNNQQYDSQNNKLMVVGHADVRGPKRYNLALSERRAEIAKKYLMSQGVPADKIETRAEGENQQLDMKQVETLQSQNTQKPEKWMASRKKATWLAYNRRVDIILEPKGQESTNAYPNNAADVRLLWQRPAPNLKAVESASEMPSGSEQAEEGSAEN
jgi:OmpA family